MRVFILAGGFATRLWPLTEHRAKPLLPIAGKPIISHIVEALPKAYRTTVSTNAAFAKDFHQWKKGLRRKDIDIAVEDAAGDDEKRGALGAVAAWIESEKIDEDILLIAGDTFTACNIERFVGCFRGRPLVAGHDIASLDAARSFGTIVLGESTANGLVDVRSFEEKPLHPKSSIVSAGWWILPRATLPVLLSYARKHPDNVGGIFEEFLRQGIAVDCFPFKELWKDIGSFEAYLSLHREIVRETQIIGEGSRIDEASKLHGAIALGERTVIEASTLTDCIVFGSCVIRDCVLERCIIDVHCELHGIDLSEKMLREGTVLHSRFRA